MRRIEMFPVVGTTAVLVNNFEGIYDAQVKDGEIYLFVSINSELPESKITISVVKNNVVLKGDEGEYFRTVF